MKLDLHVHKRLNFILQAVKAKLGGVKDEINLIRKSSNVFNIYFFEEMKDWFLSKP